MRTVVLASQVNKRIHPRLWPIRFGLRIPYSTSTPLISFDEFVSNEGVLLLELEFNLETSWQQLVNSISLQ